MTLSGSASSPEVPYGQLRRFPRFLQHHRSQRMGPPAASPPERLLEQIHRMERALSIGLMRLLDGSATSCDESAQKSHQISEHFRIFGAAASLLREQEEGPDAVMLYVRNAMNRVLLCQKQDSPSQEITERMALLDEDPMDENTMVGRLNKAIMSLLSHTSTNPSAFQLLLLASNLKNEADTLGSTEIFASYKLASEANRLTWWDIRSAIIEETAKMVEQYLQRQNETESQLSAFVTKKRLQYEGPARDRWKTAVLTSVLGREERARLDLDTFQPVRYAGPLCVNDMNTLFLHTDLPSDTPGGIHDPETDTEEKAFDYLPAREAVLEAVRNSKAYGPGAAERLEREMDEGKIRFYLSILTQRMVAFFTTRRMQEGGEYLDWWTAGELNSGLAEATLLTPLLSVDKQRYYDVNWSSVGPCIEQLGGIGWGLTGEEDYPSPYVTGSTLNTDELAHCAAKLPQHEPAITEACRKARATPGTSHRFVIEGQEHVVHHVTVTIAARIREMRAGKSMGSELFRVSGELINGSGMVLLRCIRDPDPSISNSVTFIFGPDPRSQERRDLARSAMEELRSELKTVYSGSVGTNDPQNSL